MKRASLLFVILVCTAAWLPAVRAQDVQQHVHEHGSAVMPFDLASSLHVFRMTSTGGVQRVVTREHPGNPKQVALIREHLRMEATRFGKGDFADPSALHGSKMPGLAELAAGEARMKVEYRETPDGAEIRFAASDIDLITAIHRWFGAQLSEHGADARAE